MTSALILQKSIISQISPYPSLPSISDVSGELAQGVSGWYGGLFIWGAEYMNWRCVIFYYKHVYLRDCL